jgi:hypothetical protein
LLSQYRLHRPARSEFNWTGHLRDKKYVRIKESLACSHVILLPRRTYSERDKPGFNLRTFACPMCAATESIVAAHIQLAHTRRVPIEEYPDLVGRLGFLSMRREKCGHD